MGYSLFVIININNINDQYIIYTIAKYRETVQNLSEAFKTKNLDHAKELMVQLQYWETIRRAIIEWSPSH